MSGMFITVEGCEGVGKSTQLRLLRDYLEATAQDAVFTREPGGTPVAEELRAIILDQNKPVSPLTEAYLFAAARADHMQTVILPALAAGKIVVCDRFIDSSLAYQGKARGLGFDAVYAVNRVALQGRMPDCTVFLDMNPLRSWRKQKGKVIEGDRMESESEAFHALVYSGFKELEAASGGRYAAVIPQEEKQETHRLILEALRARGCIK